MVGKQMDKIKVPDKIDVKIGSKLEAKWTETLEKIEQTIMVDEINLKLAKGSLVIAKAEIEKEKATYKLGR